METPEGEVIGWLVWVCWCVGEGRDPLRGPAEHVPISIEGLMITLGKVLSGLAFIGKDLFHIGDGGLSLRIVYK